MNFDQYILLICGILCIPLSIFYFQKIKRQRDYENTLPMQSRLAYRLMNRAEHNWFMTSTIMSGFFILWWAIRYFE